MGASDFISWLVFFFFLLICASYHTFELWVYLEIGCDRLWNTYIAIFNITFLAYYRRYITSEVVAALLNNVEMCRRNSREPVKNLEPHWPQSNALWATVACMLPSSGISTVAASLRGLLYAPCLKTWRAARLTSHTSLLSEIPLPSESHCGVWTVLVQAVLGL